MGKPIRCKEEIMSALQFTPQASSEEKEMLFRYALIEVLTDIRGALDSIVCVIEDLTHEVKIR